MVVSTLCFWKSSERCLVYVSLQTKSNRETSHSVILRVFFDRFSLAIFKTFAQYASVNFGKEVDICLGKKVISAASCQILFEFSRFSWSIFEVRSWDLTLLIIFFTWKTTTTNLKNCIEKIINTINFCGKKISWYLQIFMKKSWN